MERQIIELLNEALGALEYVGTSGHELPLHLATQVGRAQALVKLALEAELEDVELSLPGDAIDMLDIMQEAATDDPEIPCE